MLSNAYFLAKFRFDTAENEPAKNLQKFANFLNFDRGEQSQPRDLVDALLAQLRELRALGRCRATQVVAESRLDKPHALEEAVKSEPKQITPHPTLDLGRTVVDDLPKEK